MHQKVFCEVCRNDVEYTIATVPMVGIIKGKEYDYVGTEARCANCGSLVYVPEISDANLKILYHIFQKNKNETHKTFYVTFRVEGLYTAEVQADTEEEARKEATRCYEDADFGALNDIDAEIIVVEQ